VREDDLEAEGKVTVGEAMSRLKRERSLEQRDCNTAGSCIAALA
jgi:hypothetical protein